VIDIYAFDSVLLKEFPPFIRQHDGPRSQ